MIRRSPQAFKQAARAALRDAPLQQALHRARSGFVAKRAQAVRNCPDFEVWRDRARDVKDAALDNLDPLLATFEAAVHRQGGQLHHAADANAACQAIVAICREADARLIAKGKSMVGEEVGLNEALAAAGFEVIETDLGEYVIQLADEPPSHIIAPAVHKTRRQIADLFARHHTGLTGRRSEVGDLVDEARQVLRAVFPAADVGITGANLLIAETGAGMLVTNEGNGDLCSSLPRVHIMIAGIEKVVPSMAEAADILQVLSRSATGQPITCYTSFYAGPKRAEDCEGPEQFHVVLVDNGRRALLNSEFRDILRCLRCGACMNHCAVYQSIGGHAYGSVYAGPVGAVLTPWMYGPAVAADLPQACTLNGHCADVCPVRIPLPDLLRKWRNRLHENAVSAAADRYGLAVFGWLARRVRAYRFCTRIGSWLLRNVFGRRGVITRLPGAVGWVAHRDLPTPNERTFFTQYRAGRRS